MSSQPLSFVDVEETLSDRYTQTMHSGKHRLVADEPVELGGNDNGPGPYEYVLMGLGACTSMTIRMYAERKKIPLQKVRVRLHHHKIHIEDCSDCESKEGMVEEIFREIYLDGDLTAEQRQTLLDIANRCPVHRTLVSEIKIRSSLVE